jgi:hypothetical protein
MATNNHNLFPLPYWAPALWRVPMSLQQVTDVYRWGCRRESDKDRWPSMSAVSLSGHWDWRAHVRS